MKISEDNRPFVKISISFLISLTYLGFGFYLSSDFPSFSSIMKIFGIFGSAITFFYLIVVITTWSQKIEDRMREWFLFWLETANTLLIITAVAFFIRLFIVQPFVVRGDSMEPNFHEGQILVVNEISYKLGQKPKRGDVIVFKYPKNPKEKFIKRIIATPGESVIAEDGKIYIQSDGKKIHLEEGYIPYENQTDKGFNQQWDIGEKEYFVMGDNRLPTRSSDSRYWGPLPKENIIGKVWFTVWPFNQLGIFKSPNYSP